MLAVVFVVCISIAFVPIHYALHWWDTRIYNDWMKLVSDRNVTRYPAPNEYYLFQFVALAVCVAPVLIYDIFLLKQLDVDELVHNQIWLYPTLMLVPNIAAFILYILRNSRRKTRRNPQYPAEPLYDPRDY